MGTSGSQRLKERKGKDVAWIGAYYTNLKNFETIMSRDGQTVALHD